MTPTSLPRFALVLVGVLGIICLGGCRKVPGFFESNPKPKPVPVSPAHSSTTPRIDLGAEAVATATEYLTALSDRHYAAAYDLLSRDSQSAHTRANFEQQGKQGMPLYDLSTAKADITGERAMVTVQQAEDPATHGIHLTREGDRWKVVYRGGVPGSPLAE